MPNIRFTKSAIRELKRDPDGKQKLYWSEGADHRGLGILVSGVTDTKTWVVQGQLKNGKSRRISIGPVHVLSIEQAWSEAQPKLAAMLLGGDPKQTVPQRQMASMTVTEILDDYLTDNSNLRPATIRMYRASAKHLGDLLNRSMRDITPEEVERRFRHIERDVVARREQGKIVGGTNVTGKAISNCAIRLFGSLWEFQSERDKGLGANPVRGRRFQRQWHDLERRTRIIPTDRLADFYRAARHLPSDIQRDLVLIGLFTGMREGECSGLRWDEVDLPTKMLHLPPPRMKGGKPFDLPMTDLVHSILVARRTIGREGAHVFFGYGKSGHCESFAFAVSQITTATGIKVSPHDLRRTYASIAATCEIPPIALKMLIAHSTGSDVTSGYIQLSLAEFRKAAQKVADRFKELCGIEVPAGENVANFKVAIN